MHVQHHLDAATSEIALSSFGSDAELSLKQLQLGDQDELENAGGGLSRAGLSVPCALQHASLSAALLRGYACKFADSGTEQPSCG